MYLLDTNIWLERMLDQEKAEEVAIFLDQVEADQILITDFSLHSIGVLLFRLKRRDELQNFVEDLFVNGAVNLISLEPTDTQRLLQVAKSYKLDFDDAYQYVAAEKFEAELVSFDSDFDRTKRGRVTPQTVVERFQ